MFCDNVCRQYDASGVGAIWFGPCAPETLEQSDPDKFGTFTCERHQGDDRKVNRMATQSEGWARVPPRGILCGDRASARHR